MIIFQFHFHYIIENDADKFYAASMKNFSYGNFPTLRTILLEHEIKYFQEENYIRVNNFIECNFKKKKNLGNFSWLCFFLKPQIYK